MTNGSGRGRTGFVAVPYFSGFISAHRRLKIFFQEAGMTIKTNVLIQAACVSLLLVLLPGTAAPQEPKETTAEQQPAKTSGGAEQLKSAAVTTPSAGAAEPQPKQEETPAIAAEAAVPAAGKESLYTIKRGDTLWDISNTFFKDPFLWPFLWKANPSITNPDLIYPGNKLVIPSLAPIERAIQAPAAPAMTKEEAPGEEMAAAPPARPKPPISAAEEAPAGGGEIIAPAEEAQPVIDKYSFLSAGFVNDAESVGAIVGPADQEKTIMGYDDVVYVRFRDGNNVNIGDKFLIYAPLQVVKHPRTRETFGRLIRGLGILQVTAKAPDADVVTARITLSFDAIAGGSLLAPYQEPSLVFESAERKAKEISGYILEVTDHRTINGQTDVVYLDKGSTDGVDPGDKFIVYADPAKRGYPREMVGEVQVFLVKERTSTAMVRKSIDVLQKGQAVDFKK
jgi:hypothetical protein